MKFSKFNVITQVDDKSILFNALHNTFSQFDNEINENIVLTNLDTNVLSFMEKQGIILDEEIDEAKLVFEQYVRIMNNDTLHLIILPTMVCNFRCTYCYEDKTKEKMSEKIVKSIINFVKREIKHANGLRVSWFGGELLLCLDIIEKINCELIDIARFYRIPFMLDMTTNGYLFNIQAFRKLLSFKITSYQVSG
jgi:uncharacterized protein